MPRLRVMPLGGIVALIGASAIFIACGSGSSDKTATSQPAASSPPRATTSAATATTAGGNGLNVTARDFLFDPNKLSAKPGQMVAINFKNDGSTTHTFTLYTDEDHTKTVANGDSGPVTAGGSKALKISFAS